MGGPAGEPTLPALLLANLFFQALNVAAAEGFDFSAQFEIPADRVVAKDTVAIHHR